LVFALLQLEKRRRRQGVVEMLEYESALGVFRGICRMVRMVSG